MQKNAFFFFYYLIIRLPSTKPLNRRLLIIILPRSPTARVHVAAGGNIIWNPFLLMAKCRGDGREPSQRVQHCRCDSVVLSPRRVIALNNTRSLTASAWSSRSTIGLTARRGPKKARRGPKVQRGPNFKFNLGPRSALDHAQPLHIQCTYNLNKIENIKLTIYKS